MRNPLLFALTALALAAAPEAAVPQDAESPYPVSELFPVEPGRNAERGFAVAVDGDWLAMGAPRDDSAPETTNTGAVYLFHWSGTTWDQKKKLSADTPLPGAQLGFALAMRNGILAAGAPGEGVVYVFAENDGVWSLAKKLTGTQHGVRTFGRSLALDGARVAVGAVGAHGATDGAVYLYTIGSWALEQMVHPQAGQKGERFGSAVSLAGDILAVGAPGYDVGTGTPGSDAGAVYVFQRGPLRWREKKEKLLPPGSPPAAGQQFGSAVATDGAQIFVGAPTADPAGANSGALYWFVQGPAGRWDRRDLPDVQGLVAGDQLGASLALSGNLLVAGAPAPPPGTGPGKAHLFRSTDASWHEVDLPLAGSAEDRDLAGLAVAVDGARERAVVGGVLGDQGDGAAGAVWSFHCPVKRPEDCRPTQAYAEEAEAVARDDPSAGKRYGAAVALTHDFMAVGAPESGTVYLYRRANLGWRQEARLRSAYKGDGFGSSVALVGSLLAVGAPQVRSPGASGDPIDYPNGSVDLFVRHGSSWVFEATLAPPAETTFGASVIISDSVVFGTSVAIADGVVAVGAPGNSVVYLFQKEQGSQVWTGAGVLRAPAEGFGAAVSLRGGVLAIGAPGAADGVGAAYVSMRGPAGWTQPQPLPDPPPVAGRALGSAVAVGDGIIAVGAPGFLGRNEAGIPLYGAVFLYSMASTSWGTPVRLSALAPRRFGSAVALLGDRLVVGAPGSGETDPGTDDLDRAAVFERQNGVWKVVADLDALQPPHGDEFGFAVALAEDFFVVTSPEPPRGDRVTVFALPPAKGGRP